MQYLLALTLLPPPTYLLLPFFYFLPTKVGVVHVTGVVSLQSVPKNGEVAPSVTSSQAEPLSLRGISPSLVSSPPLSFPPSFLFLIINQTAATLQSGLLILNICNFLVTVEP